MVTPISYYNLIEAFEKPGCGVCRLLKKDTDDFLDALLYEYVNDFDINAAFRKGRGLCNPHAWQFRSYSGNVLGIAILYDAALDAVLKIIDQNAGKAAGGSSRLGRMLGNSGSPLAQQLAAQGACVCCESVAASEKRYVGVLVDYIMDEKFQTAFKKSDGLCLPHFRGALNHAKTPDSADLYVTIQTEVWKRLQAELREFMRKNNKSVPVLEPISDGEATSWSRTIARMAGEAAIFGMRRDVP